MKDTRLERIIIEDEVICDYCGRVIKEGSSVYAKFYKDEKDEDLYYYYWCSKECLDNHESEELMRELKRGLHDTASDYDCFNEKEY